MIVYRNSETEADSSKEVLRLAARLRSISRASAISHDDIVDIFIDVTGLEAALTDAHNGGSDRVDPFTSTLREMSLAAARALCASWRRTPADARPCLWEMLERLEKLQGRVPPKVILRKQEGYSYYGLYPETYIEASLRFRAAYAAFRLGYASLAADTLEWYSGCRTFSETSAAVFASAQKGISGIGHGAHGSIVSEIRVIRGGQNSGVRSRTPI